MTTRIYLLRHGETEWNRFGNRYCGRSDVPLSEVGQAQAERAAGALAATPFIGVWCSPLHRARQTAETIATGRDLPVFVEEGLTEIDFGLWEGLTPEEIQRTYEADWRNWRHDPATTRAGRTGETACEVVERLESAMAAIMERTAGGTALVVGHNTAFRLLIASTLDMPLASYRRLVLSNCGISVLERGDPAHGDEPWRWLRVNDTAHLGP